MSKEKFNINKVITKILLNIDEMLMNTKPLRSMFLGIIMIIVYVEFLIPKLNWSKWIITPAFIFVIIGLIWESIRKDLININKK